MSERRMMALDKAFCNALAEMDCHRGKQYADLFEEFLDLSLTLFCGNPNDTQQSLWKEVQSSPKRFETFIAAFSAYGEAAENYHDPLGDFFMEHVSHGQHGQFFTPETICDFMAKITNPMSETINDPCCGSGRLPLAGLRQARENGVEPFLYANDLSYTCARMALLNFIVNSARGEVSCGDTLRLDLENFIFFKIDRVMLGNKWLSTYWQYTSSNVDEVNEKRNAWRKTMLENGIWIEIAEHSSCMEEDEPSKIVDEVEKIIETRPEETELPRLTAIPKATAVQLDLFEQFEM